MTTFKLCSFFGHSEIVRTEDLKKRLRSTIEDLIVNKNYGIRLCSSLCLKDKCALHTPLRVQKIEKAQKALLFLVRTFGTRLCEHSEYISRAEMSCISYANDYVRVFVWKTSGHCTHPCEYKKRKPRRLYYFWYEPLGLVYANIVNIYRERKCLAFHTRTITFESLSERQVCVAHTLASTKKEKAQKALLFFGTPKGTRTPDSAVRGRRLNRLTMGAYFGLFYYISKILYLQVF